MFDDIKAWVGRFLSAVFAVVILSPFFAGVQPWQPERGEFGYGLWFLVVDIGSTALSLVSPGVVGAALVVIGWLALDKFGDGGFR